MASDFDTLLDMGFEKARAELAIKKTGGRKVLQITRSQIKGLIYCLVQAALEWLEANQEKSYEDIIAAATHADDEPNEDSLPLQPGETARSLVCKDCGRKFRSQAQAEFHASKTQHIDFAESTEEVAPLTEEEKEAKLEDLRRKLAEKRTGMSQQDQIDKKRNEAREIRRKSTKESQDIKEELKKKEQLKEAAAKRREKQDELEAKARIKAKIAADKEERRLRADKDKAEREGRGAPPMLQASAAPATPGSVESKPSSAYSEARLRLQTSAGNLQKTFPVTATLFEVAATIMQDTGIEVQSFTQNFPKKVFDAVDFGTSLKELGLVPTIHMIENMGEQSKACAIVGNPFEDVKPHISEYTAQEIATLSRRLEKKLGPEYISTRPGAAGQRVPYLAGDKCISLANEVFGFNGWSSSIQQIQIDFVEESQSTGKVSLGLSVIVRVTLRDGAHHEVRVLICIRNVFAHIPEDLGYGHIENCKSKAAAFEKAKKQGTTDALKRALRNFGNVLGNCVHDTDYMSKVTKMQVAPSKWDPEKLHRHPDYAPVTKKITVDQGHDVAQIKKEAASEKVVLQSKGAGNDGIGDPEDEFATDDFDEVDFSVGHELNSADLPFEQTIHANGEDRVRSEVKVFGSRTGAGMLHARLRFQEGSTYIRAANGNDSRSLDEPQSETLSPLVAQQHGPHHSTYPRPQQTPSKASTQAMGSKEHPLVHNGHDLGKLPSLASAINSLDPPLGFFTARAAESIQNSPDAPFKAPSFNPHLESPSIRKTAGIDHSKTKPVGRDIVGAPPLPTTVGHAARSAGFVNSQVDKTRRLGMPAVANASPLSNRNSYKPPQLKRPAEGGTSDQLTRSALGDVTGAMVNGPLNEVGGDAKRPKTGELVQQSTGQNSASATKQR
ncbi:MAG: hypothetical protein LQ352_002244 [Teloschistes flavicans]|nr:MAG: hypothetical protein LQ352_002244 [Teloschistes flavicans]